MLKPRRALFVVCCAVLLLALGLVVFRSREPSYQGRSLSQWLDDYHNSFQPVHGEIPHQP